MSNPQSEIAATDEDSKETAERPRTGDAAHAFDESGRTIAWMARTINRLYNAAAQPILDREGVNIAHWYYLRVLAQRGTMNQLELSKRVGIASTTTVTALDSLEKRDLVRRTRDKNDRRKHFVSLTDEGRRVIDRAMPDIEEMLAASIHGIPASDIRTLWAVLHQVAKNLSQAVRSEAVLD